MPNNELRNGWGNKEVVRCVSMSSYWIWGPWRGWWTDLHAPLQKGLPHEETAGHSTSPPPHCWNSPTAPETHDQWINGKQLALKISAVPSARRISWTQRRSQIPFWRHTWTRCLCLWCCRLLRRSPAWEIDSVHTPVPLCTHNSQVVDPKKKTTQWCYECWLVNTVLQPCYNIYGYNICRHLTFT